MAEAARLSQAAIWRAARRVAGFVYEEAACPRPSSPSTIGQPNFIALRIHGSISPFITVNMSGFEVAEVVLGSSPFVISALEHYRDGLRAIRRWRKYEGELQSLIRNIETERAKLQDICEKLLVG